MHFSSLNPVEQRVLGCLIEKRWTTPDQYPLSLNSLRLACNQSTNRDPVTSYQEPEVRAAAQRLSGYGLARLASGAGSRTIKYRHLAEEGLGLDREGLGVLCVLLLRGSQTPGEIKQRTERLAPLGTLADVDRVLEVLIGRGYAERLARRPGQKEERFRHLLGDAPGSRPSMAPARDVPPEADPVPRPAGPANPLGPPDPSPHAAPIEPVTTGPGADLEARVAALEDELARLRAQLAELLD